MFSKATSPARERAWIETDAVLKAAAVPWSPARERAWIETHWSCRPITLNMVARS